jgi:putative addiction module component (TIGR02574 family)
LALGEKLAFQDVFGYGALMSIDQIAAEALRLSPSERAMLAESLWESLSDPFEAVESDEPSTIQLAAERDRQIEAGAVQAISHEELMARLRR